MHKTRDVATQVDQRMQLDRSLASAEPCPGKEGQTEIDCCGIERIDRLFQVDAQRVAGIELASPCDEHGREIGVDAPVSVVIGLGQCIACDVSPNPNVVQFGLQGVQTDFDVAQAGSVRQLGKGHAQKLIEA